MAKRNSKATRRPARLRANTVAALRGPKKTKVTFYLDTDSLERIKAVCERSPFLTLGGVLSTVCQHLAPQLERLFPPGNGGPVSRSIARACRVASEEHREVVDIMSQPRGERR